jgi:hypothetical protein
MPRKTTDPKLIALKDRLDKAGQGCDRWWRRLRRAVNALEKLRRQMARLSRQIHDLEHQPKE